MLLKVNLVKEKERELSRSLEEFEAEKKEALKEHNKSAVATVK